MQNNDALTSGLQIDPAEQILAQRKAFETAVTLRAWSDAAFAEQLTQDPVAAINAAFGIDLPADLDIQLHHESPTRLHLALPPMPALASRSDELNDDDLERVAGGSFGIAASIATVAVSGTASVATTLFAGAASAAVSATVTLHR